MSRYMPEMSAASFIAYASRPDLSSDEVYTIELLIEHARVRLEKDYWSGDYQKRGDLRERPDYVPSLPREYLAPGAEYLATATWISLQRLRSDQRPVRSLEPLRHLPALTGLSLGSNEISDLAPLVGCSKLKKLFLNNNNVRDASPLAGCPELEELEIRENPVEDFSALASLPRLKELEISSEQLPAFVRLKILPVLQKLHVGSDWFDSLISFPDLPGLLSLHNVHVRDLRGIERFTALQSLSNLFGEFASLEPLRNLRNLTNVHILESRVQTAEPLSALYALRDLSIRTSEPKLDFSSLEKLPALHELTIKCDGQEPSELAAFQATLPSWDIEFLSPNRRCEPSLTIEVVDQKTFDYYDGTCGYGVGPEDTNEALLSSELSWLDERLEEVLKVDFEEDEDYALPFRWAGARSRTVMLLSERAIEAFPRLALGLQEVLSNARHDWILYFQSDCFEMENGEFIVWLYPDKIVTTPEYVETVRRLITP